jgi:hypothetical protein
MPSRAKAYQKRGGGAPRVSPDEALVVEAAGRDCVAPDDALNALEAVDPRKCRAVEVRFFKGLSVEDIAKALQVSASTVIRDENDRLGLHSVSFPTVPLRDPEADESRMAGFITVQAGHEGGVYVSEASE